MVLSVSGIVTVVVNLVTNTITQLGYPGIFFLMVLEGMLLPIPSEVVMLFGGFLVYEGKLQGAVGIPGWTILLIVGSVGNLCGALIAYYIGKYGGKPAIERYGKYVLLDKGAADRITGWFDRYGPPSVFLTRLVPVFRTFVSIPAGIATMNRTKFSAYTLTGMLIWDSMLIYLGLQLGPNWNTILGDFDKYTYASVALAAAVLLYFGYRILKRRRITEAGEQ